MQTITNPAGTKLYTIAYDAVGKVTSDGVTGDSITYTPFQRPATVSHSGGHSVSMEYDADHNRLARLDSDGNISFYLPDSDAVQAKGSTTITWHTYYMADGQRVAEDTGSLPGGTLVTRYFANDYQNSIGFVTDDTYNGTNPVETVGYDAFGKPRNVNGTPDATFGASSTEPRGYINQEMLPEVQLIDLNARYFDPFLAKFLAPDPVIGNMDDSQAWNPYAYGHNDPMSTEDPTGLWYVQGKNPCSSAGAGSSEVEGADDSATDSVSGFGGNSGAGAPAASQGTAKQTQAAANDPKATANAKQTGATGGSAATGGNVAVRTLTSAQHSAMTNPRYQPTAGGAPSHCSEATAAIANAIGANTAPLVRPDGTAYTANQQVENLRGASNTPDSGWTHGDISAAQHAANEGGLVVSGWHSSPGEVHGHTVTVAPDQHNAHSATNPTMAQVTTRQNGGNGITTFRRSYGQSKIPQVEFFFAVPR